MSVTRTREALPVIDTALTDRWRRRIEYLRVSVTDRCNYRCSYCMPVEGFPRVPRDELLSLEETAAFVEIMAELGVRRVRITGGEPLARKGVVDLVGWVAALPAIEQVAMTTNGHLLSRFAAPLFAAGLRGLNVSLDTFDARRFAAITRGGDLDAVVRGLAAAEAAGFENIKINAVAIRGFNDAEAPEFVERCWAAGWVPRFIELMPMGGLEFQDDARRVPTGELVERLGARFELAPEGRPAGPIPLGPAQYHVVTSGPWAGRRVGMISPMSDHGFCAACNRARLTSRGGLRACLANDDEVSILHGVRALVAAEAAEQPRLRAALVAHVRAAVEGKLEAHRMRDAEVVPGTVMTGIGG